MEVVVTGKKIDTLPLAGECIADKAKEVSAKVLVELIKRSSEELEKASDTLLDASRELDHIINHIGESW